MRRPAPGAAPGAAPPKTAALCAVALCALVTLGLGLSCAGRPRGPEDASSSATAAPGATRVFAPGEVRDYQGQNPDPAAAYPDLAIKGSQAIDPAAWRLEIGGLVESPASYSLAEVLALPAAEKYITLHCVEGWQATSLWSGPPLEDLLDAAGPRPGAVNVILEAYDGYTTSLPLALVRRYHLILATRINGISLPAARGFPLRLAAESRWGYKWIKWVTRIRLSDDPEYRGTWEELGYSIEGEAGAARLDPSPAAGRVPAL